jgi:aminoglycoside phosphotransferase (APT) family kinase protein
VVGEKLPPGFAEAPEARRRMGQALMQTLARLHAVDPEAVGLGDFGRSHGYLERQVTRWAKQWERSKVDELPLLDELARRLRAALPDRSDAAIVHGDYRLGNVALARDDPGRLVAIFDWEMATLGDPLADLGYTLIYWGEAGDGRAMRGPGPFASVTAQEGFHTRAGLVEAYARARGREVGDVAFYEVLALYKLAVISEGIYARYLQGKTVGEGFEGMERTSVTLAERALAVAEASSVPALRGA